MIDLDHFGFNVVVADVELKEIQTRYLLIWTDRQTDRYNNIATSKPNLKTISSLTRSTNKPDQLRILVVDMLTSNYRGISILYPQACV